MTHSSSWAQTSSDCGKVGATLPQGTRRTSRPERRATQVLDTEGTETDLADQAAQSDATREFAFERDLRNYLVRNVELIEPGLHLYEEEGITGVEFPVGGRYIDILAVDRSGSYVVIELKVSRGYDRVMGQLLRYMGWVRQNMETSQDVKGIIVANDITSDLRLASSHVQNVRLIEYQISFSLRPVE